MAKLNMTLDTRKPLKNNTYPIKVSIYFRGKGQLIFSIGIYVLKEEWNGQHIIKSPRKNVLNSFLRKRFNAIDDEVLNMEVNGEISKLSLPQIKARLIASFDHEEAEGAKSDDNTLIEVAFKAFAETSKAKMTKSIYLQTLAKLGVSYDLSTLRFADINNKWLRDWEYIMRDGGMSTNAISVHMRNLRAVFNRAIDDDIIPQDQYPFRKYKIKQEKTAKRSLTVEELRTFMNYPCQSHQVKYRDYFMLIFYLLGINMVDLSRLTEIKDGRIEYRRAKTGRLYSIKVENEALDIIKRYKGKKLLLDIHDRTLDYHNFLARLNENLKEIGELKWVANSAKDPQNIKNNKKEIVPLFPNLSTYWARHTWATIAASLDIPKETIAAALGHGQSSITDIYIDFDQRKVDEANRVVIDYLHNH